MQVATIVAAPTVTQNTANILLSAVLNRGTAGSASSATATQLTVTFTTAPTSAGAMTAVDTSFGGASGSTVQVATVATQFNQPGLL